MAGKAGGIRAGKAYIELGVDDKVLQGLKAARKHLDGFGKQLQSIGQRTLAVGLGAKAALTAAAAAFGKRGGDLFDMSKRTGASVEALSEMRYAAEQSSATIEDLETGLKRMQVAVAEASLGSSEAADGLARLGLSAAQLQGLSPDEQMQAMADAMASIKDPAERTAAAVKIMGRGGTALLPMLEQLRALRAEARQFGLTISTHDAQTAKRLADAFTLLRFTAEKITFAVGGALASSLTDLSRDLATLATNVAAWITQNKQLVLLLAKASTWTIGVGAAFIALGLAVRLAAKFAGVAILAFRALRIVLASVVALLTLNPLALLIGGLLAIAAATAVIGYRMGLFRGLLSAVTGKWRTVKDEALKSWNAILNAVRAGDLSLAFEIAFKSIEVAWLKLVHSMRLGLEDLRADLASVMLRIGGFGADELKRLRQLNEGDKSQIVTDIEEATKDLEALRAKALGMTHGLGGPGEGGAGKSGFGGVAETLRGSMREGTFSSRALWGLGLTRDDAKRTALATQQTARNTAQLLQRVKRAKAQTWGP